MYWSTNPLLQIFVFRSAMSRDRYLNILKFLQFANNENYDPSDPNRDRLFKIRSVVELLVQRFQSVYLPGENISIDEELIKCKGKLSFKQYIPQKRARFGVKLFTLCKDTGYCWNSFVYIGRNTQLTDEEHKMVRSIGKSGLVVIQLIKDLFGTGRKLFVDNFYSIENLFRLLEKNNIAACGTLCKGRVKLPKSFTRKKLAKGESDFRRNGNLIVVRFHDKKVIQLISTFHHANFVYTGKLNYNQEPVIKLAVIHNYNQHMGGVD